MKTEFRPVRLAALCSLLAFFFIDTSPTQAQAQQQGVLQKSVAVDIPPQQLTQALIAFSKQAGIQVMMSADVVGGLSTQGAHGQMSIAEAMTRLLEGTRLSFHSAGGNTVGIRDGRTGAAVGRGSDFLLAKVEQQPEELPQTATPPTARESNRASGPGAENAGSVPEILVKGSRVLNSDIKRSREDAQPYVVFERDKIEQSTAKNLEQFLRDRLPMNVAGLENAQRPTASGNQSAINLRGLGTNQTLILIDGRRAVGGGSYGGSPTQPDINTIPLSAIERVEILPGTASGIYGGGATGGVVNIILRHDYSGAEVKATYGNTFDSDVASRRIDLSAGLDMEGGKSNLLVMSTYSDQNLLHLQERSFLVDRFFSIARANDPSLLLPPNNPPLGTTPNIRSASGANLQLKPIYGNTVLSSPMTYLPSGYAGVATGGTAALVTNAGQYNTALPSTWQQTSGQAPLNAVTTNKSIGATLRREFTATVSAFVETSFAESKTSSPYMHTVGSRVGPYRVAASAPNNPFTTDVLVSFPTGTEPAGEFFTRMRQMRAVGGLIASLPAGWQGGVDYTWARHRRDYDLFAVTGGTQDAALVLNGTIDVLRDTGTFPVNLTPYQAPVSNGIVPQYVTLRNAALRLSGPVFDLPGGPVGVSTLFEYRTEAIDEAFQYGSNIIYPAKSQSVASAYLETRFPLVSSKNSKPGVQSLELQLAARADRYRTDGSTPFFIIGSNTPVVNGRNETDSINPTIALRYQPVNDIALRLSYATGFVAPDVSQLATTADVAPTSVNDPRRGGALVSIPGTSILRGGNPDLKPEKSESWSAGMMFTPTAMPGLRVSLDYLRIEKTDNIATYPTGVQGLVNDEALFPGRVQRGTNLPGDQPGWAGPITLLNVSLFNIAKAQVEAFDAQLDYSWSTRWGHFTFFTVATKQTHYKTQGLAGQPVIENVGYSYRFPRKLTGNMELKWQRGEWTAGWISRYHDSYLAANPAVPGSAPANTLQGNGGKVPSQIYHDTFFGWRPQATSSGIGRLLSDTELQLNIRNVLDKAPPFDAGLYLIFRDTFYSPLGDALMRSYQLSLSKQFR